MVRCGEVVEEEDDEYAKLVRRMNPPRVVIDNDSCDNATVIRVDRVKKHGILLEAVQVLVDLNLVITKAYISSDGNWFMDVFNVTDQDGSKLQNREIIDHIQKCLESEEYLVPPATGLTHGDVPSEDHSSTIELTGVDRPGLLSEVCAVLASLSCNIVKAEVWTHDRRAAAVIQVTDEATGLAIRDAGRLSTAQELLCNVMQGQGAGASNRSTGAKKGGSSSTGVSVGAAHAERRLHKLMLDDGGAATRERASSTERAHGHVTRASPFLLPPPVPSRRRRRFAWRRRASRVSMASVSTAPRAPLPAAAAAASSSSSCAPRQLDPNPNGRFLAAQRGLRLRVRRLAGAAPSRRGSVVRCAARSPDADAGGERPRRGWDAMLHDAFQGAVRRWSEYVSNHWPSPPAAKEAVLGKRVESSREDEVMSGDEEEREVELEDGKWSWERWKRHFALIEESERLVDELQLQLRTAVYREDYRSAHKLKLAIAATAKNDTVGRAISDLNRAIEEERYRDATFIRDHAGAGLLGWWSGISGNLSDPYGLIIRISAEHGRYVARSYDTRQLASDGPGFPVFETHFAEANGGYNLQAVHLKPDDSDSDQLPNKLREKLGIDNINISSSSLGSKHEEFDGDVKMDDQDNDDSNIAAGPAGLKNLPSDSTAIPRIKILKVIPMENVNQDYIINIFDQISEEDDNDDPEVENESSHNIGDEDNSEVAETVSAEENGDESGDESDIEALISIDFINDYASHSSAEAFERMPARLERRDRFSFSFYTEQYSKKQDARKAQQTSKKTIGLHTNQQDDDGFVQLDRVKLSGSNKKLSILQLGIKQHNKKVQQKLSGVTHFSRIQMPLSSDPLISLYVTASGFDSKILSLQRKYGQWREDNSSEEHRDLLFYEYVEAVKLTGDNLLPAGQVVFRAKVGEHYQLPHKGIIPRELGVVARYKGQRKIADPGFQNPRWVDGELLILDGKFIRDGPVIAFFYWTSNFHLFEFFRRLRLPD